MEFILYSLVLFKPKLRRRYHELRTNSHMQSYSSGQGAGRNLTFWCKTPHGWDIHSYDRVSSNRDKQAQIHRCIVPTYTRPSV